MSTCAFQPVRVCIYLILPSWTHRDKALLTRRQKELSLFMTLGSSENPSMGKKDISNWMAPVGTIISTGSLKVIMYLRVVLIHTLSGQALGQMTKDMTAKPSIFLSLVGLLCCPQPSPVSLRLKKMTCFSIFSGSSISATYSSLCPSAHTHAHTKHTSCQSQRQRGRSP